MALASQRTQVMRRVVMRHVVHRTCVGWTGHMCSRLGVIAALTGVLAACSNDHSSSPFLVRDSAGVTIVESLEPMWEEDEGWWLSDEPAVTIGQDDGREEYSLFEVRGAVRLPNGRIVVANGGSDQLRYYDSIGVHLYSVGQDGYGPGEFKIMRAMWRVGDSLVINDRGQDRITVWTADGEYGRTVMLHREPGSGAPNAVGVFFDGSVLGMQFVFDRSAISEEGMNFVNPDMVLRRYSPDGVLLDSLGVFFYAELISEMLNRRTDEATGIAYGSSVSSSAPFGREASWSASGDHVYYGSSQRYEILVMSKSGTLERIVRRLIPNEPVTASDIQEFREEFVDEDSRFATWQRRRVEELKYPDTKPAYGTFTVDALGYIWVAEYDSGEEEGVRDWTVFDPEGTMLGIARIPSGGRVYEIGEDYVLGKWLTELDVEQVRMYRLHRN